MIEAHSAAWTEPLFIFLTLIGLHVLASCSKRENKLLVVLAAIVIGMSVLTRYAGVASIMTGCVAIVFLGSKSRRQKLSDVVIFVAVALLCSLLFSFRNYQISGGAVTRGFRYNSAVSAHFDAMVTGLASWTLPGVDRLRILPAQDVVVPVIFVAAVAFGIYLVVHLLREDPAEIPGKKDERHERPEIMKVLLIFVICYVGVLWISVLFASVPPLFDNRLLSPIMIPVVVIVVCGLNSIYSTLQSKQLKKWLPVVAILITIVYLVAGASLISYLFENGRGYAGRSWQYEEIDEAIASLPENARLYSNQPAYLSFAFEECSSGLAFSEVDISSLLTQSFSEPETGSTAFVIYYEDARQFTPIKKEAQGQSELSRQELESALENFDSTLLVNERNAFVYEVRKKGRVN